MEQNYYTWRDNEIVSDKKTAVTVLSGFLGTGKTTLLNALLLNSGMKNVAVLVNDVGDVNVDASLIKSSAEQNGTALKQVVELTSGCICCSMNSDLASAIFSLITDYSPDHIIIESSGVAEPGNTFASLFVPNGYGKKISDLLEFQNMITLVNPDYFNKKWKSAKEEKKRTHLLLSDPRQPLIELLISQVEFSDIVVLTHTDICSESSVLQAKLLIRSLNNHTEIVMASKGDIDPEILLKPRFGAQSTADGTRWRSILKNHEVPSDHAEEEHHEHEHHEHEHHEHEHHEHEHHEHEHHEHEHHDHGHEHHGHEHHGHAHHKHTDYGITTWVYRARKPFRHYDFLKVMKESFPSILRAKGFYWSDEQPDRAGFLSLAANILRMDYTGEWFAVMCEQGKRSADELPESLKKVWDEQHGDRRQEIVFIGIDMDTNLLQEMLDSCLS